MDYETVLEYLAPCGLNCGQCFAHTQGEISRAARVLQGHLGNFDSYAQRFSTFLPQFTKYPEFKELLSHFASPDCNGCRKGNCKYPNCGVVGCHVEKGVDFCFQCPEFPCTRTHFDPNLEQRWIIMNNRMKEIGVEAYYEETRGRCRYL